MSNIPNHHSTVSEWLNYMGSIHVSAIDMGLERVLPVAKKLGVLTHDLAKKPYVFTVAGTNGKGSTTTLISEICCHAGYRTALYQSPHLISFNERIKLDGQMVDDKTLIDAFYQVEQARQTCGLTLSFFEMTTLAALVIFKSLNADIWVLEIGLGGRLDVVNIIDPDMCVITNIGIDHTDWLGDNIEKIGFEKAGILRQNSTLIFGSSDMPKSVATAITDTQSKVYQYQQDFLDHLDDDTLIYSSGALTLALPKPNISPINTATAISAVLASKLNIHTDAIRAAISSTKLAGRFDFRMITDRRWLFDVAHNEHGIRFLIGQFVPFYQALQDKHPDMRLYVVFSMLADKDIDKVLQSIKQTNLHIHAWYIGQIDNPRAIDTKALSHKLHTHLPNAQVYTHDTIAQAVLGVLTHSTQKDMILCFGSFHTIGESLIALGEASDPRLPS